jgi:hypothetical protein
MFLFPFLKQNLGIILYFITWEWERSWNVEHGNRNMDHVPVQGAKSMKLSQNQIVLLAKQN